MSPVAKMCFITDGGGHLGLGHVQQSTTFATEFNGAADIVFLTKSGSIVADKITGSGFRVVRCRNDEEILAELQRQDPALVLFDKIDVDEGLARTIRTDLDVPLVIFTNLTQANRYADIAVTADIGSNFQNVKYVDESTNTLYMYGPKYWILRKDFYRYSKIAKPVPIEIRNIVLIFGGSDPANLTSETLKHLLNARRSYHVDVVIGATFQHRGALNEVLADGKNNPLHIVVHENIANVAELMFASDLVIASPGLSAFEALRVGTPVIVVPHDDLQKDTYIGVFSLLDRSQLDSLVARVDARAFSSPQEPRIAEMEIGLGLDELRATILELARRNHCEMG